MGDRVRGLIVALAPEGVCDDCIAERFELASPDEASRLIHELAGESGFERLKLACAICAVTKTVTRGHPK